MNHNEKSLFNLCKKGDLNKVKNLIEIEDVDLNLRDKWDSTPLYYACLCGHIELVQYLLSNGKNLSKKDLIQEIVFILDTLLIFQKKKGNIFF